MLPVATLANGVVRFCIQSNHSKTWPTAKSTRYCISKSPNRIADNEYDDRFAGHHGVLGLQTASSSDNLPETFQNSSENLLDLCFHAQHTHSNLRCHA